MTGIINVNKERENKGIEPVKSNCRTCLYFDGRVCKFNKTTQNRKYCIKYEYSKPSLVKKQKKPKNSNNQDLIKSERVVKKTTFNKISQFLGVRITFEKLQQRYRNYQKGYSLKIYSTEPLIIVLRNNKTKKKFYYEIIE
jgi:hypothetical protein